jgi:hypothetical protein
MKGCAEVNAALYAALAGTGGAALLPFAAEAVEIALTRLGA